MKLSPFRGVAALVVTAALALTGCASSTPDTADASGSDTGLSGELTIFAAASLSGAFDQLADDFEAANPGAEVLPATYDGSSVLATQLIEGAAADVFASADEPNMAKVTNAGLAESAEPFATKNTLEIAVTPDNPFGIEGLDISRRRHGIRTADRRALRGRGAVRQRIEDADRRGRDHDHPGQRRAERHRRALEGQIR